MLDIASLCWPVRPRKDLEVSQQWLVYDSIVLVLQNVIWKSIHSSDWTNHSKIMLISSWNLACSGLHQNKQLKRFFSCRPRGRTWFQREGTWFWKPICFHRLAYHKNFVCSENYPSSKVPSLVWNFVPFGTAHKFWWDVDETSTCSIDPVSPAEIAQILSVVFFVDTLDHLAESLQLNRQLAGTLHSTKSTDILTLQRTGVISKRSLVLQTRRPVKLDLFLVDSMSTVYASFDVNEMSGWWKIP